MLLRQPLAQHRALLDLTDVPRKQLQAMCVMTEQIALDEHFGHVERHCFIETRRLEQRLGERHQRVGREPLCGRAGCGHRRHQYTARPPDTSNTAPVENEHSSDASQATIDATSSTRPKRAIGIFDSMKSMCCWLI